MALGGALRAALRAGDWARAAAQSRRQARALRSFSPEFGERPRRSANEFLRSRGVDVPADRYVPFEEIPAQLGGGFGARGMTSDGRVVFTRDLGMEGPTQRFSYNPDILRPGYSPIASPYEGMRVLPGSYDARYGETMSRPGPWMGRGRGTEWAELPLDGSYPYDSGSYFEQFPGPRMTNLSNPFDGYRPSFPWATFGEFSPPFPRPGGYV